MEKMTIYFVPHSSFRGNQPPRSDTLFGAICWGYRLLFGNKRLQNVLGMFTRHAVPFLVSSLFRYTEQHGEKIHLLPKPLTESFLPEWMHEQPGFDELRALKMLRKKHTVSANDFSDIIYGKKNEQTFYEQILQDLQEKRGNKREGPQPVSIRHVQRPHSTINRLTGSADGPRFFYTEEFFLSSAYEGQAGVFCCVKCREELANDLKAVFYFLADTGIGGGASVGKGHIRTVDIVSDYLPYEEPEEETEHIVILSLTFPDEAIRRVLSKSWYVLEKRQGKVESMYTTPGPKGHVWKDHVLMLKEGSTFPQNGKQSYYGENRIVREGRHDLGFDVQQYGYAFTVNTNHITSVYQNERSRQKL